MPQLIIFLIIALIIGIITIVILANDLSYRKSELEKNRIYECELRGEINESKRILQTQTSLKSRENNLLKEKISSLN